MSMGWGALLPWGWGRGAGGGPCGAAGSHGGLWWLLEGCLSARWSLSWVDSDAGCAGADGSCCSTPVVAVNGASQGLLFPFWGADGSVAVLGGQWCPVPWQLGRLSLCHNATSGWWFHCWGDGPIAMVVGSECSAAAEVMRPTAPWPWRWTRGPLATVMGANGPVAVVMGPMFPLPW